MRWLFLLALLWPMHVLAQSSEVLPSELKLSVEVEAREHAPYTNEMVLITIRGEYKRHITREKLVQPDFEGFNWTQLGPDSWTEERVGGRSVKIFRRRMAIYPDRAGELTIGAFTHKLTLTDEGDDWFDHEIYSEPVTITVEEAPPVDGWWFPTRWLEVSDQWSNAPELLKPGEGVLRVIRIEALGVMPEMIPPMPDMTSPSAMIFPHPEKRLVELSPAGPITYAFWRWTIRPTNNISTIIEPITFSYFDTENRVHREVTISAQRVAYGDLEGPSAPPSETAPPEPATLPGWPLGLLGVGVFALGLTGALRERRIVGLRALERLGPFDPLARRLRMAARAGDLRQMRRAAAAILDRDGISERRVQLLRELDAGVFRPGAPGIDMRAFYRAFLARRARPPAMPGRS